MFFKFGKCFRGRTDCDAIRCTFATPDNIDKLTDKQFDELDFIPVSFVCSGLVNDESRTIKQDKYRLCFKNECSDEMSDNDIKDLVSVQDAVSGALLYDAVVNDYLHDEAEK